ncbi:MFS transporter [Actinacidiphila bryophytorum]|uniref:Predicted arabinose efflux permease, MFS family n=1 Tax=Actinacidiphila bryophytorum TaxID=1436133 RepID=A0A9W4MIS0_9ACTN|nr:MFS transporter [Actinacidiphila bryophytorum]MBM9439804.1 MFS transporter [Actinacidiphila bryophytorum]MBN6547789.1 MFS transporter [Actinacidiphila bryophytorum]CAG7648020.1 Predicted arabinose efflux permease, MFS family [Actinacidiphila bryophytorum]
MSRVAGRGLLRRHRDFRLLWYGETAGKFGASVTGVAMPLAAVATLHAGTFEVGLLSAAAWAPWLLIGLPAGVWVDRMRRRPVMLAAAAVSLLLYAALPVAAWAGRLSIGLLLAVALLAGTAAVFFQTAYSAYLPGVLAPEDQAEGNAKLHGSASAAQIAGLGTGGLIAQAAGAVSGMAANAGTFLVSLLCLARIRHREPPAPRAERPRHALAREVAEGLRLIAHDPWLRTLTLFGAASNLALMGYQSIQVVFLVRTVGLAPGTVGVLVAATGAGGVAGAFAARRVAGRIGTARATLVFELGLATPAVLMALTTGGAGVLLFVAGGSSVAAGVVAGNVVKAGFQQRYCPPELFGRLTASTAFVSYGTVPLGALLGGALGTALGLRSAMAVTTAGVPLAALVLLCSPVRGRRDLPVFSGARGDVPGADELGCPTGVVDRRSTPRPGGASCRRSG